LDDFAVQISADDDPSQTAAALQQGRPARGSGGIAVYGNGVCSVRRPGTIVAAAAAPACMVLKDRAATVTVGGFNSGTSVPTWKGWAAAPVLARVSRNARRPKLRAVGRSPP
jgi:hypothetical protein